MKRRLSSVIIVILLLGLFFLMTSNCYAKEEIEIECAHTSTTTHPVHLALLRANELIQDKTNGRIKLKIYPNGTYGGQVNCIKALQMGQLDAFIGGASSDQWSLGGILLCPYLFRDSEHWKKFKESEICDDFLEKQGEIMGWKPLCVYQFGFRHVTTKDLPAKTPEDFEGFKLRVVNAPPYEEAATVINAVPTPIPFSEVYMALKTGVVDGQENPFSMIYTMKFYEAQKYLILTGHMLAVDYYNMSLKMWNSLSKEDQEIIKEVFKEAANYEDELIIKQEQEYLAKLKDLGMIVIEPERELFMKRGEIVLKKYPAWEELYMKIRAIK